MNSPTPAIELDAVSKRYGSRTIIHNMTFSVFPGEIVGFLGPNGAGKTTTMRMIAGYTTASSGSVRVSGYDMAYNNDVAAKKLGYLPESPPLYDALTVTQYLRFVASAKDVAHARIPSQLDRVMTACRLEDVTKREVYKLSKGYRQRLGLAQALLGDPEVLLLDEPTAGLDPGQIQETREVIRSVGQQHAVLLSTHILHEVTLICQRVAIINGGRLLAIDTPAGLKRAVEASNRVTLEVSGDGQALRDELQSIDGVNAVTVTSSAENAGYLHAECLIDTRAGIESRIARSVAAKFDLHRLERQQPTLENIFLRYVANTQGEVRAP